ncbi:MAG TPA: universal stress protein [Candidatus Binatia bacterium]|jgi:nucleotide-binding universal stress UspA family protein
MYKKILVPLDGSKTAEAVVPLARSWSTRLNLPVELIAVVDTMDLARNLATIERFYINNLVDEETRRCGEYLEKTAKNFFPDGCRSRLEKGSAANIIIDAAAADQSTLIMMATHGRSGIHRWLLGSVAEKVLRGTSNPLLLVRAPRETRAGGQAVLNSIVVPLDGSALAEQALPSVAELAKKLDVEVILFRAYTAPYDIYGAAGSYTVDQDQLRAAIGTDVSQYLEEKADVLRKAGLERVLCASREGFSADEIIKYARGRPDSLIAICTHGRSGVKRWVLGSVTETVVRHSVDPVLILRAPS